MRFKAVLRFCLMTLPLLAGFASAQAAPLKIVALGDSLMAGYELPADDAYPAKLQAALKARGIDAVVENGAVSGDTTADGLARLDWTIPDDADAVLVELGANDALRGVSPAEARANLKAILSRLKERGKPVMLFGMLAPPNMGAEYGEAFNAIYPELAREYDVPLYPFFLDGVITESSLKLSDGMHPNAKGVDRLVEKTLPAVEAFVKTIKPRAK
ncbi:arylesterase [Gellertiella hungarica]|uniref:Acyl-CoA thioesterase-1 n=1 Tax=Gellertiella hungarica TaxID=1572859 RepID=A0A7W6J5N8_9HYPH|nr:arylesterase [Gellertiella hungarica]MBB4065261.1 acyl-CoA thioesterase-1 [Gellertiella hungarica]